MFDPDALSETLELLSDGAHARKRARQVQPFRGVRGVPHGALVGVLVDVWSSDRPKLPRDADALYDLFMGAHEDGLVAIGLLAALLPDEPVEALDVADRLSEFVDDVETADALGWMVLGPGLLAAGEPFVEGLLAWRKAERPEQRRMALMASLAALPVPVEGPAAAALRERAGERRLAFVSEPMGDLVEPIVTAFLRDPSPPVAKAVVRVLRSWATVEPDRVEAFIDGVKGGVPKVLREAVTRAVRKGRRLQQRASAPPRPREPEDWE